MKLTCCNRKVIVSLAMRISCNVHPMSNISSRYNDSNADLPLKSATGTLNNFVKILRAGPSP